MSYILDSLKKSDRERQSINNSAAMVMRPPAFLENDKRSHNPIVWMALVVVVLCLVIYFGFFGEIDTNKLFNRQGSTVAADNTQILHKEIVVAPPAQQLSKEKQDAILLYEQALQQKSKPEIDSLYQELAKPVETEQVASETQSSDDDDTNPNGFTGSDVSVAVTRPLLSQKNTQIVASVPEGQNINTVPENQRLSPENELISPTVSAIAKVETDVKEGTNDQAQDNSKAVIPSIYALESNVKKKIPSINYGAHIYATDNKSGFVILNGARRRIGDKLSNGVYVEKIAEESVVLSFNGTVFSLPAMKSWIGE